MWLFLNQKNNKMRKIMKNRVVSFCFGEIGGNIGKNAVNIEFPWRAQFCRVFAVSPRLSPYARTLTLVSTNAHIICTNQVVYSIDKALHKT